MQTLTQKTSMPIRKSAKKDIFLDYARKDPKNLLSVVKKMIASDDNATAQALAHH